MNKLWNILRAWTIALWLSTAPSIAETQWEFVSRSQALLCVQDDKYHDWWRVVPCVKIAGKLSEQSLSNISNNISDTKKQLSQWLSNVRCETIPLNGAPGYNISASTESFIISCDGYKEKEAE